eukprot:2871367-Amphidinium_carterae.1
MHSRKAPVDRTAPSKVRKAQNSLAEGMPQSTRPQTLKVHPALRVLELPEPTVHILSSHKHKRRHDKSSARHTKHHAHWQPPFDSTSTR